MSWLHSAWDLFIHMDKHLSALAGAHPVGVYGLLALIVFCETGLVIWPFLPGDSLLFAVGALAAAPNSPIHLPLIVLLLCAAANCGDMLNYALGRRLGPGVFRQQRSMLFNPKHLAEAHAFYERHGRKTIILARFVPIIRTFAPFVAGIGQMPLARFIGFSIGGGILWVVTLSLAGFFFNQIPFVQTHFQLVVLAIVAVSLVPVAVQALRGRRETDALSPVAVAASSVENPSA